MFVEYHAHVQKRQLAEISNEQKFVRSGKDSCTWKENIFDPIKHIPFLPCGN
jgi:hypothetical protein